MLSQDGEEILWKPLDNDGAGTAGKKSKFIQEYVSISISKKYYLFRVEGT